MTTKPDHLDPTWHAVHTVKIFGGCLAVIALIMLLCAGILSISVPRLAPAQQFASETGIELPTDAKLLIDDYEYHIPVIAFGPGAYEGLLLYQFDVPEAFARSILTKELWSTPWSNQGLTAFLNDRVPYNFKELNHVEDYFFTFQDRNHDSLKERGTIGNCTLLIVEPSKHRISLLRWDT